MNFGISCKSDTRLQKRMRFHQSWWRECVIRRDFDSAHPKGKYGALLLEEDGEAGLNFLTAYSFDLALRTQKNAEPERLLRNLLSSQAMAFNLFAPLQEHPELAVAAFEGIVGKRLESALVELEYAPKNDHLNDNTSHDAAAFCTALDGEKIVVGIETKLTEPFSQTAYDSLENPLYPDANVKVERKYRQVCRASDVWLDPDAFELADKRWNQIWRNQMLAEKIRMTEGFTRSLQIVLHHPLDASPQIICDKYSKFLARPQQSLKCIDLTELLTKWRQLPSFADHKNWLADFEARYLNLRLSEAAFQAKTSSGQNAPLTP